MKERRIRAGRVSKELLGKKDFWRRILGKDVYPVCPECKKELILAGFRFWSRIYEWTVVERPPLLHVVCECKECRKKWRMVGYGPIAIGTRSLRVETLELEGEMV